jgi:hypothetical protein
MSVPCARRTPVHTRRTEPRWQPAVAGMFNVRSRSCGASVVAARRYVGRGNTDATAQFERFRSLALSPTHGES